MSKNVFLFSGQGSQYPGMGKELAERFDASARIFECGSDILGFDLKKIIWESTAEELAQTKVSQPSIFAMSLLSLNAALESGIDASAAAGHSLGEYAAMVFSGMLDMENGFRAIKLRSEAMAEAAAANPGAMAAVMNLDAAVIEQVCAEITDGGNYVTAVNYNSNVQTVIAGTIRGIELATEALTAKGAKRVIKLAVSAAFHSKLMASAAERFKAEAAAIKFSAPSKDFYANVYGKKLTDFSDMPSYLSTHICSPVRFTAELNALKEAGFESFVELGPGKVLTGLVKKTLSDVTAVNIEDIKTLDAAIAATAGK